MSAAGEDYTFSSKLMGTNGTDHADAAGTQKPGYLP